MWLNKNIHHLSSQLSQLGVEEAIISPGSRNAPLTVALARNPHIHCTSVVDERSAAFIALGLAKANKKPVVICCTSGTALLNYYPAIAEAFYSGVPLIILSADRPPELIDNWDGQCIRQEMVFENHIQGSFSLPPYTDKEDCLEEIDEITHAVLNLAIESNGPVHLNIPLREPLYTTFPEAFSFQKGELNQAKKSKNTTVLDIDKEAKIWIINGASYNSNPKLKTILQNIETSKKAVVLNDIISNLGNGSFDFYDSFLLGKTNATEKPEILITTGKFYLSKSLKTYLRKHKPMKHFHLASSEGMVGDPLDTEPEVILGEVEANLQAIHENILGNALFYAHWETQQTIQKRKVKAFFESQDYAEFKACQTIAQSIPKNGIVHLANSTSIRYFSYLRHYLKAEEIHSNRGTSGIDGCTSTAIGFALASNRSGTNQPKENHYLITGDIAFLYDSNAFWLKQLPNNLKIIVLNNSGGGIFRYIDGPKQLPELEEFFETAHQRSAKYLAKEFGIEYHCATNTAELSKGLNAFENSKNTLLLEVFTDKYKNEKQFNKFKEI